MAVLDVAEEQVAAEQTAEDYYPADEGAYFGVFVAVVPADHVGHWG